MGQRDIVLEVSATVVKASSKQRRRKADGTVPVVRTGTFRSEIFHQVANRRRPMGLCINLYGL